MSENLRTLRSGGILRSAGTLRSAGVVALGGVVGTYVRAALEDALPASSGGWPWTTFVINLTGSLVLGFLLQTLLRRGPDTGGRRTLRLAGGTGVIGGYTTYSTFLVEDVDLFRDGHALVAVAYLLVSVVLGIAAAAAGTVAAQRFGDRGARPSDRRGDRRRNRGLRRTERASGTGVAR